jgi:hypothetical protein
MERQHRIVETASGPAPSGQFGRGRRWSVRVLALLGLVTFGFMLAFVLGDAADRMGTVGALVPPGSPEAAYGAARPGEAVHLAGAAVALMMAAVGFLGLALRPERDGAAFHTLAMTVALLAVLPIMGDPDNHGGQGLLVDPAFMVFAVFPLAAGLVARPWRHGLRVRRPAFLVLAALGAPALWYGAAQALLQRNTWPPLADPHHQAHWYAMALLSFMVVSVVASAAWGERGWRPAALSSAAASGVVGVVSLASPASASALTPAWAVVALLWGVAVLGLTLRFLPPAKRR